jgi:DNA repair exonuclease SbcCD ATPase subunit
MKLLKKQQINEQVNLERKNAIDAGVFLAKKVDALREEVLTLQKTRDEFIAGSQQVINDSLSGLQQKQDSLSKEIKELEVKRKELLKPLDEEWEKVNESMESVVNLRTELLAKEFLLNERENQIKKIENEISKLAEQTRYKETEIDKARNETLGLKISIQQEYEVAQTFRDSTEEECVKKLSELQQKITTYENGISINETKEKDLETREVALLSERKHLESQQRTFRIAKGIK